MLIVGHGMLVGLYRRAWHYHVEMGASMPWYLPGKQLPCWPSLDDSPSACRAGLNRVPQVGCLVDCIEEAPSLTL